MVVAISQFSSALNLSLKATIANDLGEVAYFLQQNWGTGMTSGTGSGAFNQVFVDRRTVAASGNDDLDLAGGLTNPFGATITLTALKAVYVRNVTTTATVITVAATVTNSVVAWNANIPANTKFAWEHRTAGLTVTAGTGDLLRITNTDGVNAATYDIVILGVE